MTAVSKAGASLGIFGDAFDPDAISVPLGAARTSSARKGETTSKLGIEQTARGARWLLTADSHQPGISTATLWNRLRR